MEIVVWHVLRTVVFTQTLTFEEGHLLLKLLLLKSHLLQVVLKRHLSHLVLPDLQLVHVVEPNGPRIILHKEKSHGDDLLLVHMLDVESYLVGLFETILLLVVLDQLQVIAHLLVVIPHELRVILVDWRKEVHHDWLAVPQLVLGVELDVLQVLEVLVCHLLFAEQLRESLRSQDLQSGLVDLVELLGMDWILESQQGHVFEVMSLVLLWLDYLWLVVLHLLLAFLTSNSLQWAKVLASDVCLLLFHDPIFGFVVIKEVLNGFRVISKNSGSVSLKEQAIQITFPFLISVIQHLTDPHELVLSGNLLVLEAVVLVHSNSEVGEAFFPEDHLRQVDLAALDFVVHRHKVVDEPNEVPLSAFELVVTLLKVVDGFVELDIIKLVYVLSFSDTWVAERIRTLKKACHSVLRPRFLLLVHRVHIDLRVRLLVR